MTIAYIRNFGVIYQEDVKYLAEYLHQFLHLQTKSVNTQPTIKKNQFYFLLNVSGHCQSLELSLPPTAQPRNFCWRDGFMGTGHPNPPTPKI